MMLFEALQNGLKHFWAEILFIREETTDINILYRLGMMTE